MKWILIILIIAGIYFGLCWFKGRADERKKFEEYGPSKW